jgi:hypothetical protein
LRISQLSTSILQGTEKKANADSGVRHVKLIPSLVLDFGHLG